MPKRIVDVSNLYKSYTTAGQTISILRNLNFQMNEGNFISIQGASGMGKSTFLNILGALDTFTSGTVEVAGISLHQKHKHNDLHLYRRNKIGFIFQNHYLLPDFTVLENVTIPLLMNKYSHKEARIKAMEVLSQIGLSERLHHYPNQISGGESQRVAVARAIVHNPCLILADEPTGNLDNKNSDIFIQILSDLCHQFHLSVLVVTHDKKLAEVADIQYSMIDGQIFLV